jgi:hypothetical protein
MLEAIKFFSYPYYKKQDILRQASRDIANVLEQTRKDMSQKAHRSKLEG